MKTNLRELKDRIENEIRRLSDVTERKKELARLQAMIDTNVEKLKSLVQKQRAKPATTAAKSTTKKAAPKRSPKAATKKPAVPKAATSKPAKKKSSTPAKKRN